jgi:uncharacterized membrane protein YdbT with pleckstrin-like domain
MSYIEKNLITNENIIHRSKRHWSIYWPAFFCLIVGVFSFIHAISVVRNDRNDNGALLGFLGFVLIPTSFIGFMSAKITRKTSEFAVTNKRVIMKVGFIWRKSMEVMLNKIESIHVDQGIIGRLFDYGSIRIIGSGGTVNQFVGITSPLEFRRVAQEEIENSKHEPERQTCSAT